MGFDPFGMGASEDRANRAGDVLYGRTGRFRHGTAYAGTPYEKTFDENQAAKAYINGGDAGLNTFYYGEQGGADPRNYMWGRDPNAANNAIGDLYKVGQAGTGYGMQGIASGERAAQVGQGLLTSREQQAADYQTRNAPNTVGYLANLENQEGPSAAQAQLQSGTNQAMNAQLALARSGRGLGGDAAAMGQAQGNIAALQANQANQAAQLRAQENAAWRQRQAQNASVAGSQYLQSQGQNDVMTSQMLGLGQQGYFQGVGAQQQGYGIGLAGLGTGLQAHGLESQIRGQELNAGLSSEDNVLRQWAAQNGYNLAQQQRQDQQNAAYVSAGAGLLAAMI